MEIVFLCKGNLIRTWLFEGFLFIKRAKHEHTCFYCSLAGFVEGILSYTINPSVLVEYGGLGRAFFAPSFSNFSDFSCLQPIFRAEGHFAPPQSG